MRVIKFRAWYNQTNEMINWNEIQECVRNIDWDDFMADCELMQYTGLKDKNGVEIYEGDIVRIKYSDNGDSYTEVVTVIYENGRGYSPFNWEYICDGCDCGLNINIIEVIGNIHQHSHLLELPK